MALLTILKYPDPRLRIQAQPITHFTPELAAIAEDMFETMYATHGVGLAATQVGINQQIFVMDVSEKQDQRFCVINPEILSKDGTQYESEGCLSVPGGVYDRVERALNVHLRAYDINGKVFELKATDLMATCIQHEMDHLNGILFIDHLSRLKQDRIRKKIVKNSRNES